MGEDGPGVPLTMFFRYAGEVLRPYFSARRERETARRRQGGSPGKRCSSPSPGEYTDSWYVGMGTQLRALPPERQPAPEEVTGRAHGATGGFLPQEKDALGRAFPPVTERLLSGRYFT